MLRGVKLSNIEEKVIECQHLTLGTDPCPMLSIIIVCLSGSNQSLHGGMAKYELARKAQKEMRRKDFQWTRRASKLPALGLLQRLQRLFSCESMLGPIPSINV